MKKNIDPKNVSTVSIFHQEGRTSKLLNTQSEYLQIRGDKLNNQMLPFTLLFVILLFSFVSNNDISAQSFSPLPFCGGDVHAMYNNYGGYYNSPNDQVVQAPLLNKPDGTFRGAYKVSDYFNGSVPSGGYVALSGRSGQFAALREDGSIAFWNESDALITNANYVIPPNGTGYVQIVNSTNIYAALRDDGTITAWGDDSAGYVSAAPTDGGYVALYASYLGFAARKSDGSITVWGSPTNGGAGAPTDNGYVAISTIGKGFAALKADGSISAWGHADATTNAPTDNGYQRIYSTGSAFAAIKADGSITAWGNASIGGTGAPSGTGFTYIATTQGSFAALNTDGTITAWGQASRGADDEPTDNGYVSIFANNESFTALKADGSLSSWGGRVTTNTAESPNTPPTDNGYVSVTGSLLAWAAMKADGSITVWGYDRYGGASSGSSNLYRIAPSDNGYVFITSVRQVFVAMKADGTVNAWGDSGHYPHDNPPTDGGYNGMHLTTANNRDVKCIPGLAVNAAPSITSATTASFQENATGTVIDVQSTDDSDSEGSGLVYTITTSASSPDAALFSIDANGLITFLAPPDFEMPGDVGGDNVYDIEVQVCDSEPLCTTQTIAITVTDVAGECAADNGTLQDNTN